MGGFRAAVECAWLSRSPVIWFHMSWRSVSVSRSSERRFEQPKVPDLRFGTNGSLGDVQEFLEV